MDSELKREIIFDNYKERTNRGLVEDNSYLKTNTKSDSCIDKAISFITVITLLFSILVFCPTLGDFNLQPTIFGISKSLLTTCSRILLFLLIM